MDIDRLTRRAWELRRTQHEEAARLAREAARLSCEGAYAAAPYVEGLAAAEAVESFLALEAGDFATASAHGERAVALLDGRPPGETLVDALLTLTWVDLHAGNYATALRRGWQALELAQAARLPYWESGAQDALGCLYTDGGDQEEALARFDAALELARTRGFADREATALHHLADSYAVGGDHARALETGLACLELSRRAGLDYRRLVIIGTIAKALTELGRAAEALPYLDEAFALGYPLRRGVRWFTLLEARGLVHLRLGELDEAAAQLREALALSRELGILPGESACHRLLAEVHERQGHLEQALRELRRYHELHESIAGERIVSQLAFLRVVHQVETARRDAEIHRLRAATLQRQMEEGRRTVTRLELLASSDALTGLHNRRHLLELLEHEVERSLRHRHALSVLMLDLDRFKAVNDRFGHAVGDQVLQGASAIITAVARDGDAVGRYGGEEFLLLLPETGLAGAVEAAERIRRTIAATPVETNAGTVSITASVGVATLDDSLHAAGPAEILTALLDRADRALYRAKRDGRNRVEA